MTKVTTSFGGIFLAWRKIHPSCRPLTGKHLGIDVSLGPLGPLDEAPVVHARQERDADAAGRPDPQIFQERGALYRVPGEAGTVQRCADWQTALMPQQGFIARGPHHPTTARPVQHDHLLRDRRRPVGHA